MSWDKHERQEYVWPMSGDLHSPPSQQGWTIKAPPKENWEWSFGGDWFACSFRLYMKTGPNWFHRFMMKWVLGIHWRRIT